MEATKIVSKAKAMQFNEIVRETEINEITDGFCNALDYFELANNRKVTRDKIIEPSFKAKSTLLDILKRSPYYIGKGRCMINTTLRREVDLDAWDRCYQWVRGAIIRNAIQKGMYSDNWRNYLYQLTNYVFRNKYNGNYINNQDEVDLLNSVAEENGLTLRAKLGMKFTKLITGFAKETEIDKIVDIRDVSFTDNEGVFHERKKDFGWKKIQAEIGDALNVLEVKSPMFLSVNPLDILTMSCGDNWSSCHYVGAGMNWRNIDHTYSGCYSGGNIGYIDDSVTLICYTTKEGVDPDDWEAGKSHRAMFAYEDGILYQGRVYPDGRDGGDDTIAATMRNFVQKVIADGLGENNIWTLKKGTIATNEYVTAGKDYLGYRDWKSCEDGNISILQSEITDKDHVITVGTYSVCPNCGEVHYNEKCVVCERCWEHYDVECTECGSGIYLDDEDYIRCDDNDSYYCCERCAERNDVHYCRDDECWHTESNCHRDSSDGDWYYYDCDGVFTSDRNWYHNWETAEENGYRYAEDRDEWYPECDVYKDDYDGYFYYDEREMVIIGDKIYHNLDNALKDGWSEEDIESGIGREVG